MTLQAFNPVNPVYPIYHIALETDDGCLIIEALAERPFKDVFELIGKLNRQANANANAYCAEEGEQPHLFAFTARELAQTLKALAELPFNRVAALVSDLNCQMQQQMQQKMAPAAHSSKAASSHVER